MQCAAFSSVWLSCSVARGSAQASCCLCCNLAQCAPYLCRHPRGDAEGHSAHAQLPGSHQPQCPPHQGQDCAGHWLRDRHPVPVCCQGDISFVSQVCPKLAGQGSRDIVCTHRDAPQICPGQNLQDRSLSWGLQWVRPSCLALQEGPAMHKPLPGSVVLAHAAKQRTVLLCGAPAAWRGGRCPIKDVRSQGVGSWCMACLNARLSQGSLAACC